MAVVRYNATRALISGVSINDQVTLDLELATLDPAHGVMRTVHISLAREREVIYDSEEDSWTAQSIPLAQGDADDLRMFLSSVQAGEAFEFAPYNRDGDSPLDYVAVVIGSDGYKEQRVSSARGGGGADDYFVYSFTIIEAP